jgi:hypothetical protein
MGRRLTHRGWLRAIATPGYILTETDCERLESLRLCRSGKTPSEIADFLHVRARTVIEWTRSLRGPAEKRGHLGPRTNATPKKGRTPVPPHSVAVREPISILTPEDKTR